ncbi:MAG: pspE [Herbinix sp.]|jgi:rhodanese-related sulfurtransferase|nr:pspE [Herbinix sp.]
MKKIMLPLIVLTIAALSLAGCSVTKGTTDETENLVDNPLENGKSDDSTESIEGDNTETSPQVFEKITAEKAKDLMEESEKEDFILVDVRTPEEYNVGHIEGALLIPDYELADRAEEELPDKAKTVLIYCRSGNRSSKAGKVLQELGYMNVYDFGGIIDWPYDIVTE